MKSRFLDPCTGSINTPSLSGSVLGPGDPAVTRTVLCPVQPAHHWERPRLKLTAPRSGAKLLPARSLNAFLVTAGALQTDPCPQGGTQMRRTRVKKKKRAGNHGGRHSGRRSAPAYDRRRDLVQAAGCGCRPCGAGGQQNISKRVWTRFRSVRQSLWPTLPADPLFRRVSAGQRLLGHLFWVCAGKSAVSAPGDPPL